ncbi:MAG: hypothetical protein M2R45_00049 [Verrucomicrobia subdivision 3 bacterium]|nr:hypothetical protein [Limisphaerales bacterium]MCS1412492.1 hypothetical protein [Limisphaerales bacterium]
MCFCRSYFPTVPLLPASRRGCWRMRGESFSRPTQRMKATDKTPKATIPIKRFGFVASLRSVMAMTSWNARP